MTDAAKGVLAMGAAAVVWGVSPLFYAMLKHIPPAEVLAHRTFWSVVIFGVIIVVTGRGTQTQKALRDVPLLAKLSVAGLMIGINWFVFIYSVGAERVTESSLGYYFFPLVMVLFGRVVFKEALTKLQWVSVGFAAIAALILTIGFGAPPWLAIIIAISFALYGMIKRTVAIDPIVSVTVEVIALVPLAIAYLWGWGAWVDAPTLGLLIFSGVITAGPLMLMTYATRTTKMSTVGLIQYTNPMVQWFCVIAILGEVITGWHVAALALIGIALTLYSISAIQAERKRSTVS